MSQENVELARAVLQATEEFGMEALAEYLHPNCVWVTDLRVPDAGSYEGRDEVLAYIKGLRQAFGKFSFDVERIEETPAGILALTVAHGRGGVSGADVTLPWCFLGQVRDGLVIRIQSFLDRDSALEAAGLSE